MKLTRTIYSREEMTLFYGWLSEMLHKGLKAGPVVVELGRPTRNTEQNSKLWALLSDVSQQVEWPVDGEMRKLRPEEWKDIFSSALRKHQKVAKGLDGGFVVIGARTSKMSKAEFSELIELIYSFGAERGVEWSERGAEE